MIARLFTPAWLLMLSPFKKKLRRTKIKTNDSKNSFNLVAAHWLPFHPLVWVWWSPTEGLVQKVEEVWVEIVGRRAVGGQEGGPLGLTEAGMSLFQGVVGWILEVLDAGGIPKSGNNKLINKLVN